MTLVGFTLHSRNWSQRLRTFIFKHFTLVRTYLCVKRIHYKLASSQLDLLDPEATLNVCFWHGLGTRKPHDAETRKDNLNLLSFTSRIQIVVGQRCVEAIEVNQFRIKVLKPAVCPCSERNACFQLVFLSFHCRKLATTPSRTKTPRSALQLLLRNQMLLEYAESVWGGWKRHVHLQLLQDALPLLESTVLCLSSIIHNLQDNGGITPPMSCCKTSHRQWQNEKRFLCSLLSADFAGCNKNNYKA